MIDTVSVPNCGSKFGGSVAAILNTFGSAGGVVAGASGFGPHAVSAILNTNTNARTNANDFFINSSPLFFLAYYLCKF
jgi:hypothetical protein